MRQWAALWGDTFPVKTAWRDTSQSVLLPDGSVVNRTHLLAARRRGLIAFDDLRPGAVVRIV